MAGSISRPVGFVKMGGGRNLPIGTVPHPSLVIPWVPGGDLHGT
jgi:hypothetical protein